MRRADVQDGRRRARPAGARPRRRGQARGRAEPKARPFDAVGRRLQARRRVPADQAGRAVGPDAGGHDVATSSRCRTRCAPSTASCCRARRCGSCSPTTRAPARRSWPGSTSRSCMLREDVKRCLIVAPGGLVEQWQDELYLQVRARVRDPHPQLGETRVRRLGVRAAPAADRPDGPARRATRSCWPSSTKSEWDLVVVDEAHRMGAHYFGGKLKKTKRFQLGELLGDIARHLLLMTATPHTRQGGGLPALPHAAGPRPVRGQVRREGPQRRHRRA